MRQLPSIAKEEWIDCSEAVLERHFDNNSRCGDRCQRKKLTPEQKSSSAKVHRNKETDKALHTFLQSTLERFATQEVLNEVGRGSDTFVNESLSDAVAWRAPKNKTHCRASSLTNRICVALGVHSVGAAVRFATLS